MTHFKTFPFSGIIGQDQVKMALILNAINPKIGGVLIKGSKGTAKSTAVRALADLLPKMRVINNCMFNCNPDNLKEACHSCQHRIMDHILSEKDISLRSMRVINLPINATEDRVVGTVDLSKALTSGLKALEPGILAESNRNILYIDEINLLADNVADVLLDAAAMGINIIEREGISIHHPASFILVGTMNPEEGNLRPQLLDRFGLSVETDLIRDIDQRIQIIKYAELYHEDPAKFHDMFEEQQEILREKIIRARQILRSVQISDKLLRKIAEICILFETEGHRADLTINVTAKTLAAFEGRLEVSLEDIKYAAKLALPHRMRRLPFEDDKLDEDKLEKILNQDTQQEKKDDSSQMDNNNNNSNQNKEKPSHNRIQNPNPSNSTNQESFPNLSQNSDINPSENDISDKIDSNVQQSFPNEEDQVFEINSNIQIPTVLDQSRIKTTMKSSGNLISHPTDDHQGKYVSSQKKRSLNLPTSSDIAILPTINDAALNQKNIQSFKTTGKIEITDANIHYKLRDGKSSYLIIFCVDGSGSMGVDQRMSSVKGAIFSILQENYVNRDKVSLVLFRQNNAEIVLPPTKSIDLAYKLLKELPTGGTTPFAAGLMKSLKLAESEIQKNTGFIPKIIVLTDARGNVFYKDPITDIEKIGQEFLKNKIETIIIDTENSDVNLQISQKFADAAHATYYHISQIDSTNFNNILQKEGLMS